MQALSSVNERLLYQEHDRIAMPDDVPALGLRKGDEGIVRRLDLHNDTVFAFVMVSYSTGQTRGWVILEIKPDKRVHSYTTTHRQPAQATALDPIPKASHRV